LDADEKSGEERFRELVGEALDSLPDEFGRAIENVEVVVEDGHPRQTLLGLYHGVPKTSRGVGYFGVLPDVITIYRLPIEARYHTPDELRAAVRHVVLHEIAHHFGISDERLREIDAY
jgi:predicted Zn-dependent protease with MMP-like domain